MIRRILPLLLLLLMLQPAMAASVGRKSRNRYYNDDYLTRQSEINKQRRWQLMSEQALDVKGNSPEQAQLKARLKELERERADLTEQIMALKVKSQGYSQNIKAFNRQRKHDASRIQELEQKL